MGGNKSNAKQIENAGGLYCPDCGTLFSADGEDINTSAECPHCAGPMEMVCAGWEPRRTDLLATGAVITVRNVGSGATLEIETKVAVPNYSKVVTNAWEINRIMLQGNNVLDPDTDNPVFRVYSTSLDAALKFHNNPDREIIRVQEAQACVRKDDQMP